MNEDLNKILQAVNNTLSVKTQVKRKKKTTAVQNKQLFISLINNLEKSQAREHILAIEFGIDKSHYDELFYSIIDNLIQITFGQGIAELIFFYVYERRNLDGSINMLNDDKGNKIKLDNAEDLWNLMIKINPKLEK